MTGKKIAVVLLSSGGPSGGKTVRPFLFNYFWDKNIISLWCPSVRLLLAFLNSLFRSKGKYWKNCEKLECRSPNLENTLEIAHSLEMELKRRNENTRVFICMSYWHPMADSVAPQVQSFNPDSVVVIPLYPQFSTMTSRPAIQKWKRSCRKIGFKASTSIICCYPKEDGFINAVVERLKPVFAMAKEFASVNKTMKPILIFSANGLPKSVIKAGDPYQNKCEMTAQAIVEKIGLSDSDYKITYNSGNCFQKMQTPRTIDVISEYSDLKTPIVVCPISHVSDDIETIVEMGMEYKATAEQKGCPYYAVVPAVGNHPDFIKCLEGIVNLCSNKVGVSSVDDDYLDCIRKNSRCCHRLPDMIGETEESTCPACLLLQKFGLKFFKDKLSKPK